jgi:hypothetical protein
MPSLSHDALAVSLLPLSSASPLSFSLLSTGGGEGLGPRRNGRGGLDRRIEHAPQRTDDLHVATEKMAGFVHALTEIGLKIKLPGLSGERLDIPSSLAAGPRLQIQISSSPICDSLFLQLMHLLGFLFQNECSTRCYRVVLGQSSAPRNAILGVLPSIGWSNRRRLPPWWLVRPCTTSH